MSQQEVFDPFLPLPTFIQTFRLQMCGGQLRMPKVHPSNSLFVRAAIAVGSLLLDVRLKLAVATVVLGAGALGTSATPPVPQQHYVVDDQ